jgi:hypothetical protein
VFGGADGQQLLFQDSFSLSADQLCLAQLLGISGGVLDLSREALILNGFASAITQITGGTSADLDFTGSGVLSEDITTILTASCVRLTLTLDGQFLVNERDSNPPEIPKGILKLVSSNITGNIFTIVVKNVGDGTIGLGKVEIELGFVVDPSWGYPDSATIWDKLSKGTVVLLPGEVKAFSFQLSQLPADAMGKFHDYMAFWFPNYNRDPDPDYRFVVSQNGVQFTCIQHRDWVGVTLRVRPIGGGGSPKSIVTFTPCFLTQVIGP